MLGIIAILLSFIPFVSLFTALPLGIVALILGIVGMSRVKKQIATNKGANLTGIILGSIAVFLSIVISIATGAALSSISDDLSSPSNTDSATALDDEEAPPEDEVESEDEAPTTAGVGEAVSTDNFTLTVTSVETGIEYVGDEFLSAEPQGQYIGVTVEVKNETSEPVYFFDSDVTLKDDDGNTYGSDSEAGIYSDEDSIFLDELNPGNTASGVIYFDVPTDASPTSLEFGPDLFGDPVIVNIS